MIVVRKQSEIDPSLVLIAYHVDAHLGLCGMINETTLKLDQIFPRFVSWGVAFIIWDRAKKAEDKPKWFPRGKRATIQALGARLHENTVRMIREKR